MSLSNLIRRIFQTTPRVPEPTATDEEAPVAAPQDVPEDAANQTAEMSATDAAPVSYISELSARNRELRARLDRIRSSRPPRVSSIAPAAAAESDGETAATFESDRVEAEGSSEASQELAQSA